MTPTRPGAGARALRNDARLIKTLLLSALVPEVDSLKALAALNHGTIRSPIPGRETQDVLRRCREWAADIGEIKVTDDTNALISIQLKFRHSRSPADAEGIPAPQKRFPKKCKKT